jgi:hypothetical protein
MHGLIIREPWIGYILDGTKTWEMRTSPAPRRGRIGLIRKGTGLVVGTAEIVDSLPPLDVAGFAATRDRHHIPAELDAEVLAAGCVHPWVLRHVRRLPCPVPAGQKAGQVIWVPLDPGAITAIDAQTGEASPLPVPKAETPRPMRANASTPARTTTSPLHALPDQIGSADEVTVMLTEGAIRNGNLSVRNALHLLPQGVIGGFSREGAAAHRLTVVFHPGETATTDVARDKMLLRCRGAVADFYARSEARGGDLVRMRRDGTGRLHFDVVRGTAPTLPALREHATGG